jgi:hypothetical protein
MALDQQFTNTVGQRHLLALSRDGTRLAYALNDQLYVRAMEQLDAAPLRGTNGLPVEPFFFARRAVGRLLRRRAFEESPGWWRRAGYDLRCAAAARRVVGR